MARKGFQHQDLDEFDDIEDTQPTSSRRNKAIDSTDPLFTLYGLHASLPFRIKVRRLAMAWSMNAEEIAVLLEAEDQIESIKTTVQSCESEWEELGSVLSNEAQTQARGRMVAELMEIKRVLEEIPNTMLDSKIIGMRLSLIERIGKLRGVESDPKKRDPEEAKAGLDLDDAMNKLTPQQLAALVARLNKA